MNYMTIEEFESTVVPKFKEHIKVLWNSLDDIKKQSVIRYKTFVTTNKENLTIVDDLTTTETIIYHILKAACMRNKFTFPHIVVLAIVTKRSIRTIKRCLCKLQEMKLIYIENRGNQANRYHVVEKYKTTWDEVVHIIMESKNRTIEQIQSFKEKIVNKAKNSFDFGSKNSKRSSFCEFSQRSYDFHKLEEALLGGRGIELKDCYS